MRRDASAWLVVSTIAMTLLVQSLTSMAIMTPTVLAPVAASELGVQASRIGLLVAWIYFVAIVTGLFCDTLIARYGPVRVLEFAVVAVSAGLVGGLGGNIVVTVLLATLAGAAHGLVNPSSSTILLRAAPPGYRSLVFSVKQTGVPLGSALASVLIPALLHFMHWHYAVTTLGVASAFALLAVAPFRPVYDRDLVPQQRLRLRDVGAPVAAIRSQPALFRLALTSAVYSSVQMSLFTYMMLYLIVELDYSLVKAGLVFSVAQAMGVVSRPVWGVVADRLNASRLLLSGLGVAMGLCGAAAAMFSPSLPLAVIVAVCAIYGASAIGWNGIYLAEVARLAPEGKVGLCTGGALMFTFSGALAGPPLFGAIVGVTGSYALGFAVFALPPLLAGLRLAFPVRVAHAAHERHGPESKSS